MFKVNNKNTRIINLEHISYFFSKFNVDFEQGNVIGWEI